MKLKNMNKEELELLSYTDLTEMILKENKHSMNTPTIFKTICNLIELSDEEYTNKIGDYYTSLTTDKRFILLEDASWDLRINHKVQIVVDEEDDVEDIDESEEIKEDIEEDIEEDIDEENNDEDLDDDDMEDLSIVSEEDMEDE